MADGKRRFIHDDGVISPSKRVRVGGEIQSLVLSHSNADTDTPCSPRSPAFSDNLSTADTSMTSRSTNRRPKKYICDFAGCDKAFDRPVRLQAHQRTHTGDRPFACNEEGCDKSFFKSEHLKAHFQNKHSNDASHVCTYIVGVNDEGEQFECGKTFTTATRLRRHVATHEEKQQTTCQEIGCGQVFRKLATLQRHIKKVHFHEKAFRCMQSVGEIDGESSGVCGEEFATIGQLKAHEKREHTGPRYFCDMCSVSPHEVYAPDQDGQDGIILFNGSQQVGFATYTDLQAHNRIVHPPTCEFCGRACESRRALTAHIDIEHSSLSERQKFDCTFAGCGQSFTRQGNLKVHLRNVHAKNKKFLCGQFDLANNDKCPGWDGHGCGMAFGTKANLENHTRTQHLNLPSLLKRRSKIKSERENMSDSALDANGVGAGYQAMSLLTGYGYEQDRPIACLEQGCLVRFKRNYDLVQHLELGHGWNVDVASERAVETEALEGGDFWIGGSDAANLMDTTEHQTNERLPNALPQREPDSFHPDGMFDEQACFEPYGQSQDMEEIDLMSLDPALVAT